ncbi:unnamed protein product [Rhodiola kirilowii]
MILTSPFATQLRHRTNFCRRFFSKPPTPMAARAFSSSRTSSESISYLTQQEATEIDQMLMGPLGFSIDQLMELAGLSVASAIADVYKSSDYNRVLTICGPGNNGGDGLVAARHLRHFGYNSSVCYPKPTPKPLYSALVTQLQSLDIPFVQVEDLPKELTSDFDIVLDAMFGFSFHGAPRAPFDQLIRHVADWRNHKHHVVVSVDIPSGWDVEQGDIGGDGLRPDMLVSLTAPKLCARKFSGAHHFLGGRFVPPAVAERFKLCLPEYPGSAMCVRIGKPPQVDISAMRVNYFSPELLEEQVEADPMDQFQMWFSDALAAGVREPNAMALTTSGKNGKPSSRMVLLKGVDKDGFVWYTNYESRKGREISENPNASLLFYWDSLNRQVRVEGTVEKVSEEESEQYFHSRPRGSQLGAIVSKQSSVVPGRQALSQLYKQLEEEFSDGREIPKPAHWGGYRLKPKLWEFWQGQPSRLHDRLQYTPEETEGNIAWRVVRLAP